MFRAPDPAAQGVLRRIWLPLLRWTFLLVHAGRLLAFATESAAFDEVLAVTRPGHRALGLVLDPRSAATGSPAAYEHFPLWYQAEKAGFVDFNFAIFLPQIVRYRLDRAPTVSTDTRRRRGGSPRTSTGHGIRRGSIATSSFATPRRCRRGTSRPTDASPSC